MRKRFLLSVFVLMFAVSCSKGGGFKGDYVVKIGDVKLTREDVQAQMSTIPPMARMSFMGPDGAARFVDELVKKEGLYLEAKKRGLEKDREAGKKIEEAGKIALVNYLIDKEIASASRVSEKDIRDYYDSHKDDFINNKEMRVSRIVVKGQDDASKVLQRLKGGEDFARVAREVSIDKSSAKAGGDMGYVSPMDKGRLDPGLVSLAFSLKRGELSGPVTMDGGIGILKVTDMKGNSVDFDQVKTVIPRKMTQEKQKMVFEKLMETVKKNFKVEINKAELAKVRPGPDAWR